MRPFYFSFLTLFFSASALFSTDTYAKDLKGIKNLLVLTQSGCEGEVKKIEHGPTTHTDTYMIPSLDYIIDLDITRIEHPGVLGPFKCIQNSFSEITDHRKLGRINLLNLTKVSDEMLAAPGYTCPEFMAEFYSQKVPFNYILEAVQPKNDELTLKFESSKGVCKPKKALAIYKQVPTCPKIINGTQIARQNLIPASVTKTIHSTNVIVLKDGSSCKQTIDCTPSLTNPNARLPIGCQ